MGGRTTPRGAILPLLVQSECPRKDTERLEAVYGGSFLPETDVLLDQPGTVEQQEEGQVIKTGADGHRDELNSQRRRGEEGGGPR